MPQLQISREDPLRVGEKMKSYKFYALRAKLDEEICLHEVKLNIANKARDKLDRDWAIDKTLGITNAPEGAYLI